MKMEKIFIEPEARFKLERLCDGNHPQEVGGYLLGQKIENDILIKDMFPVPNIAEELEKRSHYKEHPWGDHWSGLYAESIDLHKQGKFHSHPNGSIPSTGDMKSCPNLHIWIIHHGVGQHTFVAARDCHNREVLLLNQPQEEITKPHFVGENFHLSTPIIRFNGRLELDGYSKEVLKLKDETRRILLLALKHARPSNGYVNLDKVIEDAGRTRQTIRNHLNRCLKRGLLRKSWSRGDYKVDYDNVA